MSVHAREIKKDGFCWLNFAKFIVIMKLFPIILPLAMMRILLFVERVLSCFLLYLQHVPDPLGSFLLFDVLEQGLMMFVVQILFH